MVTKEYISREERAKNLLANPNTHILRINDNHYQMKSLATNITYDIISTESSWICNCPDSKYRKVVCKHAHAIMISNKLRQEARERSKIIIDEINHDKCPRCLSSNIRKHGIRHNKNYDLQRYSCKDCKNRFSFNLGFEKMSVNPKVITSAMQLYFTGESLRGVTKFLKLQGTNVSHVTVYNWITKYTELMKQYTDRIIPQVGDAWHADEVYMKVKGDLKYLFALMDQETRYWIAQEVADRKEGHDVSGLFRKGKDVTWKKPKTIITDGLHSYHEAYKKEFRTMDKSGTVHIRHIHLQGDMNNNIQERLNGEIRDREKVMRGIKKTDSVIFDGYQLYHNYIREHQGLDGKTPADMVGIDIKGNNKWLTLIQNASEKV